MFTRLAVVLVALFEVAALGQTTQPAEVVVPHNGAEQVVVAGSPGDYHLVTSSSQLTVATYEVPGIKPESRVNLAKAFRQLLVRDGRGGHAEVATIKRDGKEIPILTVVATKEMQTTIRQTVDTINTGQISFYANLPVTKFYTPKYRSAQAIADAVKGEMTNLIGFLYVDKVANKLTIEDEPDFVDFLLGVAEVYDQPSPKISARVHIVEFIDGRDRNVGVDWQALTDAFLPTSASLSIGGDRVAPTRSAEVAVAGAGGSSLSLNAGGGGVPSLRIANFSAAVDGISPQALAGFLSFLESKGVARIVNDVNVNIVNEAPTTVSTAVTIPVTATVSTDTGAKIRQDTPVLEGVELIISGSIAEVGRRLHVQATSTSIVSYSRTGLPAVAQSKLDTTVNIGDGQTMVLSGLSRQKEVEVKHQEAWDLAGLFAKRVKEKKEWKLYICITTSPPVITERPAPIPSGSRPN